MEGSMKTLALGAVCFALAAGKASRADEGPAGAMVPATGQSAAPAYPSAQFSAGMPGTGVGGGNEPFGVPSTGAMGAGAGAGAGMAGGAGAPGGAGPGEAAFPGAPALGLGGPLGGPLGGLASTPVMFGDQPPFRIPPPAQQPPPLRTTLTQKGGSTFPWLRGFKIADNQSPIPQDRVFFNFNYYDNLNFAVNRALNVPISGITAYRYQMGIEKTFFNGLASIGFRDSINNLTSRSPNSALAGSSTAVGDLNIFTKFVLYRFGQLGASSAPQGFGGLYSGGGGTGGLISGGLSLTAPTGPSSFAGSKIGRGFRDTQLQPFLGYYFQVGDFYLHGFESINVPLDRNDVTMLFNDIGVGYYVYRNPNLDGFINAFAPTFEVHANIPLNHRDVFNITDFAGSADVVDLTLGGNMLLGKRALLSAGVATPVTGPRPFSVEALALLNVYFGGRRQSLAAPAAPILGQ